MPRNKDIIVLEKIEALIYEVRGYRVMLDEDLAKLYGVTTKRLNEQVRRNKDRFPDDFGFQLSFQELTRLRSQSATSKERGGRRHLPHVFTEHGAVMLANVFNSTAAVTMSIHVVRAFVKVRHVLEEHKNLATKLKDLEKVLAAKFGHYDEQFQIAFKAINQLMFPPQKTRPRIGFDVHEPSKDD